MTVRRGEVYWVEYDPVRGSEQGGLRPAVVVQNDIGNRHSPTTIVAAMTRSLPARPYPFVVVVDAEESGLRDRGAVNCAQLTTIQQEGPQSRLRPPVGERTVRPIGRLSEEKLREVDRALAHSLGLS